MAQGLNPLPRRAGPSHPGRRLPVADSARTPCASCEAARLELKVDAEARAIAASLAIAGIYCGRSKTAAPW